MKISTEILEEFDPVGRGEAVNLIKKANDFFKATTITPPKFNIDPVSGAMLNFGGVVEFGAPPHFGIFEEKPIVRKLVEP